MWTFLILILNYGPLKVWASETSAVTIGVLPEWWPYTYLSTSSKQPPNSIHMMNLSIGPVDTQFDIVRKTRRLIDTNEIHVVLGPCDSLTSIATEKVKTPYICTTDIPGNDNFTTTFRLLPSLVQYSDVISDFVFSRNHKKKGLIYDKSKGYHLMDSLLFHHHLISKIWHLTDGTSTEDKMKNITHYLMLMRKLGIREVIVICEVENVKMILHQAWELAMLSVPFQWYFNDPGFELRSVLTAMPKFTYSFTVFTFLPDPLNTDPISEISVMNHTLTADAMDILAQSRVTDEMSNQRKRRTILQTIKSVNMNGKTGRIYFAENHFRSRYEMHVVHYNGSRYFKLGSWGPEQNGTGYGMKYENTADVIQWQSGNKVYPFPLKGRTVKVVTILENPFVFLKPDHINRTGNDRFAGYCVDLLDKLADILDFKYEIYLVHDGKFGAKLADGSWNGMIGEILAGNATLIVASLSINAQREAALDFTKPFMTRYVTVVMKVPKSKSSYFEFLYPLHWVVYACTIAAFFVIGVILYFFERKSVYHKCETNPITFRESLWFVFGSLLEGSPDGTPLTNAGRILTSTWSFFVLILIASYTANLAAFLTVKKIKAPVQSIEDLALQNEILYGTVRSSAILSFFETTNVETFRKIGTQMIDVNPSVLVNSSKEGFKRVREGNYGFFWDSTVIKYMTNRDCNLMEIGPEFASRGYGVGGPPGATYLEEISITILRLGDAGFLNDIQQKWWGSRKCNGGGAGDEEEDLNGLSLENFAGLFFVILFGIALSSFVCFVQIVIRNLSPKIKTAQEQSQIHSNYL